MSIRQAVITTRETAGNVVHGGRWSPWTTYCAHPTRAMSNEDGRCMVGAMSEATALHPNERELFGAIAGAQLPYDEMELDGGITIRRTYAHVMAPYLMAFARAERGKPHPPPWRAVSGGLSYDVVGEIYIPREVRPTGFDRLNTIWWIVALLRLVHSEGVWAPVVSDTSFTQAAKSEREPTFWPVEIFPGTAGAPTAGQISAETLDWVNRYYRQGAAMMADTGFSAAFLSLDAARSATNPAAAKLLTWAAMEALFRPGRSQISHRLCASIAAFLETGRSKQDRLYQRARKLYEARGETSHAARSPEIGSIAEALTLARRSFKRAIECGEPPRIEELLARWRTSS